jgi:hypothetical protein
MPPRPGEPSGRGGQQLAVALLDLGAVDGDRAEQPGYAFAVGVRLATPLRPRSRGTRARLLALVDGGTSLRLSLAALDEVLGVEEPAKLLIELGLTSVPRPSISTLP